MRLADRTLTDALLEAYRPVLAEGYGSGVGCHDLGHAIRVARWAHLLADEVNADPRLCVLAALFHDIGYTAGDTPRRDDHENRSADAVRRILADLPRHEVDVVAEAVAARRFAKLADAKSPVGLVLDDADNLDALGHIGVARALLWLGEHRPDAAAPPEEAVAAALATHVHDKLSRLTAAMHTETARLHAARRTVELEAFLDGLRSDVAAETG